MVDWVGSLSGAMFRAPFGANNLPSWYRQSWLEVDLTGSYSRWSANPPLLEPLLQGWQKAPKDHCIVIKFSFPIWSSGQKDLTWPLERPPSDIMKLKSSAKLSKLDWVMGERGSNIFCCISSAYLHKNHQCSQGSCQAENITRNNRKVVLHPQCNATLKVAHVGIDSAPIPDVVAGVWVRWPQNSLSYQQGLEMMRWWHFSFNSMPSSWSTCILILSGSDMISSRAATLSTCKEEIQYLSNIDIFSWKLPQGCSRRQRWGTWRGLWGWQGHRLRTWARVS